MKFKRLLIALIAVSFSLGTACGGGQTKSDQEVKETPSENTGQAADTTQNANDKAVETQGGAQQAPDSAAPAPAAANDSEDTGMMDSDKKDEEGQSGEMDEESPEMNKKAATSKDAAKMENESGDATDEM